MNEKEQRPTVMAHMTQDVARVERIERNDAGQLILHTVGGAEPFGDVELARYFPWSSPDGYVSVRNSRGNEVAMIRSMDDLDSETRQIVIDELERKIFDPKITRVLEHRREFGITTIVADTDRGPVTFQMYGRANVRVLSPTRALFRDVDGNTYELTDFDQLDPTSRRLMYQYF